MGAGRAAEFDDETTDLGSVSGRSSGPVEAAKRVHRPQQRTTNSANNWRIRIPTSFSPKFHPLCVGHAARARVHDRKWVCVPIGAIDISRILRSGKAVGTAQVDHRIAPEITREARRRRVKVHNFWIVGYSYLGITSRLPVIRQESLASVHGMLCAPIISEQRATWKSCFCLPAIPASRTPPWLLSGWGRRGRRASRA